MKLKLKYLKFCSLLICILLIFSCSKNEHNNEAVNANVEKQKDIVSKYDIDYKYYDIFGFESANIIIPKNQTNSQSLSILVNDGHNNLVVFDGGRIEDADYLCDIIKDNGGKVKYWFITHIHDDHIGALYKILSDKRVDITIESLFYDFANYDWYYEKMGSDAGIYNLFLYAIHEYNKYLNDNDFSEMKVHNANLFDFSCYYYDKWFNNETKKWMDTPYSKVQVKILNNHYEIDSDPINNTSVAYMVRVEKAKLFIPGDLGYVGGNKLFDECFKWKDITPYSDGSGFYSSNKYEPKGNFVSGENFENIDIIALSHHGQNGIDPLLYKKLKPSVIIWPTSKDVYENESKNFLTDDTKKVLSEIETIKYQIKSYEETAVIR